MICLVKAHLSYKLWVVNINYLQNIEDQKTHYIITKNILLLIIKRIEEINILLFNNYSTITQQLIVRLH